MNYLAHGYRFLDRPEFLAGTAVPDWLNVVDRKARARSARARPLVDDPDPWIAELARGVVQHHHDDGWFHSTRAFAETSLALTVRIRDLLAARDERETRATVDDAESGEERRGARDLRPFFLGHVLVELLIDSELAERTPGLLDAYYQAMASVDAARAAEVVGRICCRDVGGLAPWIPRFVAERFLDDYHDDRRLCWRLDMVLRRVGLATLPDDFATLLPAARRDVAERLEELMPADQLQAPAVTESR